MNTVVKSRILVEFEWAGFLSRIRGVLGSNRGPETRYRDCDLLWFSSVALANTGIGLKLDHDRFLNKSIFIHHQRQIILLLAALLNKAYGF